MAKEKYEVSDSLRDSIIVDIEKGMKWREIAGKNGVDLNVIYSVGGRHRVRKKSLQEEKGGVIKYYNGQRETDGKASPVKKYNINDLPEEERKRLAL